MLSEKLIYQVSLFEKKVYVDSFSYKTKFNQSLELSIEVYSEEELNEELLDHPIELFLDKNKISGLLTSIIKLNDKNNNLYKYRLIASNLIDGSSYRCFDNKTVAEIIYTVFKTQIIWSTAGEETKLYSFVMQYKESDLEFVNRVLASVGLGFYVDNNTLYVSNSKVRDFPILYLDCIENKNMASDIDCITEWEHGVDINGEYLLVATNVKKIQLGQRINTLNNTYVVESIQATGTQSGMFTGIVANNEDKVIYENKLRLIPVENTKFTIKPWHLNISDYLSAVVVKKCESSFDPCLDENGNYCIKFPFDLSDNEFSVTGVRCCNPSSLVQMPLPIGTKVILSFLAGFGEPIIIGAMPETVVSHKNAHEHIIETKGGNKISVSDKLDKTKIGLYNHSNSIELDATLNRDNVAVKARLGMLKFKAVKEINSITKQNSIGEYESASLKSEHSYLEVKKHHARFESGTICFNAAKNIKAEVLGDFNIKVQRDLKLMADGDISIFSDTYIDLYSIKGKVDMLAITGAHISADEKLSVNVSKTNIAADAKGLLLNTKKIEFTATEILKEVAVDGDYV